MIDRAARWWLNRNLDTAPMPDPDTCARVVMTEAGLVIGPCAIGPEGLLVLPYGTDVSGAESLYIATVGGVS